MKRVTLKTISVILVLVLSTLIFTSCGIIISSQKRPEGYTGGLGITYGSPVEYYWVETYDEVLEAIEELKSYGSTFQNSSFFSYEGELFDTKYCFIFAGKKHSTKKGKKLSERWAEDVEIRSYGFFEDVSIPELEYSHIEDYDVLELRSTLYFYREEEPVDIDSLTYNVRDLNDYFSISVYQGNVNLFDVIRRKEFEYKKISDECFNAVFNSMVFIGKDGLYYSENK